PQGQIEQAQALLESARRILEQQGLAGLAAWFDFDLGWVELAKGDAESADRLFRRALDGEGHGRAGSMAASAGAALALTAALQEDAERSLRMAALALEAG